MNDLNYNLTFREKDKGWQCIVSYKDKLGKWKQKSKQGFKTKKEAKNREEYLASFDGTVLTSGSHIVVGTVVIRTSNELTLLQQKLLESNIIAALQGKNENIVTPESKPNQNETNKDSNVNIDSDTNVNTDTEIDTSEKLPTIEELKAKAIEDAENFVLQYSDIDSDSWATPVYVTEYLCYVCGYSEEIALYAIENGDIDWHLQAKKYANNYLVYESNYGYPAVWIPYEDIKDMLLYEEKFSYDVVMETMDSIDWDEQIVKYVQHLSGYYDDFSRYQAKWELSEILANEDGINYVLENSEIDWKKHALCMANKLWEEYKYFDENENDIIADIIEELSSVWEYSDEEIEYAISNMSKS